MKRTVLEQSSSRMSLMMTHFPAQDALSQWESLIVVETLLHPPVKCCSHSPYKAWSLFHIISEILSFAVAKASSQGSHTSLSHHESLQKAHTKATSAYAASGPVY